MLQNFKILEDPFEGESPIMASPIFQEGPCPSEHLLYNGSKLEFCAFSGLKEDRLGRKPEKKEKNSIEVNRGK